MVLLSQIHFKYQYLCRQFTTQWRQFIILYVLVFRLPKNVFFENIDEVDNNSVKYLSILTLIETDCCIYHKTFYTGRIIKRLISILVNEIRAKPLLLSETRHRFGVKTDICVSLDSTGAYKSLSLSLSLLCLFSVSLALSFYQYWS